LNITHSLLFSLQLSGWRVGLTAEAPQDAEG
jgi:hypothetical protein